MATFVLVHGGCHGGWCFSRVASRLEAQGHRVFTPTLSGLAERAHLASQPINLSTHIQDIMDVIESQDLHDIILCGHSYGGMVITGVASQAPTRIKTLFYLDAVVPQNDDESMMDIVGPEATRLLLGWAGKTGTMLEPPGSQYFEVYGADAEWVDKMCTPHPVGCFLQKLRLSGKEALVSRRTFVLAERHKSINHATYARLKELPDWKTVSLDRGHDVMVDDPDTVAALLSEEIGR